MMRAAASAAAIALDRARALGIEEPEARDVRDDEPREDDEEDVAGERARDLPRQRPEKFTCAGAGVGGRAWRSTFALNT
jgi:hypothetical protein